MEFAASPEACFIKVEERNWEKLPTIAGWLLNYSVIYYFVKPSNSEVENTAVHISGNTLALVKLWLHPTVDAKLAIFEEPFQFQSFSCPVDDPDLLKKLVQHWENFHGGIAEDKPTLTLGNVKVLVEYVTDRNVTP
jgi:hypothetical protein